MNELVAIREPAPVDNYRMSTDAASVCKEIVVATSSNIQGRNYVSVEGWQAIAIAHGCAAGSGHVERIEGGVRAIGEVRRMSDGQLIATAEGFVGEDEETWFGGKNKWGKELPKRPDYAIRAMAQTRAISRACRSAFAHVVVMMNADLQTTPADEVPANGFDDKPLTTQTDKAPEQRPVADKPKPSGQLRDDQFALIGTLGPAVGKPLMNICKAYGIDSIAELTEAQATKLIEHLKNQPKQALKQLAPAGDILDDSIPY